MASILPRSVIEIENSPKVKRQLLDRAADVFAAGKTGKNATTTTNEAELYEQIGRLTVENEWLKKKRIASTDDKRTWIEPAHPRLSIARQCELVGLARSAYYYQPATESDENLSLMRLIDEQYMETPFYGSRRMTIHLRHLGYAVNRKRTQRLMQKMGIAAVYAKPKTSVPHPSHQGYPYLLRDLAITAPEQVWCADITYIAMPRGFMYLVAVLARRYRSPLVQSLRRLMGDLEHAGDHVLFGGFG